MSMIALMWRDRRSGFESLQVLDVPENIRTLKKIWPDSIVLGKDGTIYAGSTFVVGPPIIVVCDHVDKIGIPVFVGGGSCVFVLQNELSEDDQVKIYEMFPNAPAFLPRGSR